MWAGGDGVAPPGLRPAARPSYSGQTKFTCKAGAHALLQVSRFDLMDDFKDFFSDPANRRKVYKPKPGAKLVETHAVAIVGCVRVRVHARARARARARAHARAVCRLRQNWLLWHVPLRACLCHVAGPASSHPPIEASRPPWARA